MDAITENQHRKVPQLWHQVSLRQKVMHYVKQVLFREKIAAYVQRQNLHQFQDLRQMKQIRAALESLDFAESHMQDAEIVRNDRTVLEIALRHAKPNGLYLEFGVWSGRSINFIAERHRGPVHGFDSFEGLPEDWCGKYYKGDFATKGWLPEVHPNVQLHVGWFNDTLPIFIREHSGPVAFLHIDCDLYSSTRTIFQLLGDWIDSGTVIVFDEYFNYPGWQQHEHKAFQEFLADRKLAARFFCYSEKDWNAAAVIL